MADVYVVNSVEDAPGLPAGAKKELAKPGNSVVLYGEEGKQVLYRLPGSASRIRRTLTPVLRALRSGARARGARLHLPEIIDPKDVHVLAQTGVLAAAAPFRAAHQPRPARYRAAPPASRERDAGDEDSEITLEMRYTHHNQIPIGRRAGVLAHASLIARHLATDRLDPAQFEDRVVQICAPLRDRIRVGVIRDPTRRGLALLGAVGQGAAVPPRLLAVEYGGRGAKAQSPPALLVGKGITFDTGGLHLKGTRHIENMYLDKGGAAAAVGAVWALAQLRGSERVVALLPMAENSIGSRAVKPSALLTALDGTTVEVGNTDAEGRLAMADAITWGTHTYQPPTIIDIATLTGSCVVALGEHTAGLFHNRRGKGLAKRLRRAGRACGEEVWPLPIKAEHRDALKGEHADITNDGHVHGGGASFAAAFLEHFVSPDIEWAHLDIAGPGMLSKPHGYLPKGGTGFGAQLLAEHFLRRDD